MDNQTAESYGDPSIEGFIFGANGRAGAPTPARPTIFPAATRPSQTVRPTAPPATLGRRVHLRQGPAPRPSRIFAASQVLFR
jgi:hypothetical protein